MPRHTLTPQPEAVLPRDAEEADAFLFLRLARPLKSRLKLFVVSGGYGSQADAIRDLIRKHTPVAGGEG